MPHLQRPGHHGLRAARCAPRHAGPSRAAGAGAFLRSVAELETAVRERVPLVVLVWVDGGYGLIGWKQDLHFGRRSAVGFDNPDFVQLAESSGAVRPRSA